MLGIKNNLGLRGNIANRNCQRCGKFVGETYIIDKRYFKNPICLECACNLSFLTKQYEHTEPTTINKTDICQFCINYDDINIQPECVACQDYDNFVNACTSPLDYNLLEKTRHKGEKNVSYNKNRK